MTRVNLDEFQKLAETASGAPDYDVMLKFAEACSARNILSLIALIRKAEAEREALRNVCAEAYQMAGALDAPVEALDNLAAAMAGQPLPHETFLPVEPKKMELLTDEELNGCKRIADHGTSSTWSYRFARAAAFALARKSGIEVAE